ncbi:MAG: calcium/sodium antiporter [Bacteroidales bacterium]|nr:calcium/sodium antiporter [Bacteroidales bacterium]
MLIDILFILLGLALLVKGGDYLVDGSVAIAKRARLSEMVIGLTVVGFGTSMPELLVSAQSALIGNSGIAIGNVVGSNISNIALILGVTALVHVIPAKRTTLLIDLPFMLLSLILFVVIAMTGSVGRVAGVIGVLMLICFVTYQVRLSRKANKAQEKLATERQEQSTAAEPMALWKAIILVVVSFLAMVFGANILVEGASNIARLLGVSDRIIGLTIVAIGTSLPELFSSVMAAVKGKSDMAIGNIIGSVTFNILSVIGISAIIMPITGTNIGFAFDYGLMVILGVLLWIFLRSKYVLERWEGFVLTAIYVAYLTKLIILG